MSGSNKITTERSHKTLLELVAQPGNDVCADCKARNPRWASHNLGIFLCVNCASIHRTMGTHISKVKSITFDSWTKEQVEVMKNHGNVKSNAYYNSNEIRNPPPPSMMEHERDSELEQYIRSKYQYKRFLDKSALVASKLGPSRSTSSVSPAPRPQPAVAPAARPSTVAIPTTTTQTHMSQSRSVSQPLSSQSQMAQTRSVSQPLKPSSQPQQSKQQTPQVQLSDQVWEDLISLQAPASSSLPLQFQVSNPAQPLNIPNPNQGLQPNMYGNGNLSASPGYGMGLTQTATGMGMNPNGNGMSMGMSMGTNPFQQQQFNTGVSPMPSQHQQPPFNAPFPASSMPSGIGFGAPTLGQQYFAGGVPAATPMTQPTQQQQYFQPQPLAPQQPLLQQQMFMPGTPVLQQQQGQQFLSHSPQAQGQQHLMPQSHSPFGSSQSHSPFGGSHSPFGQQREGQVQGEQMFVQGGYQGQQWGQGGYVGQGQGQQQWGGM